MPFVRSVTIAVHNSSSVDLGIINGMLTGGNWGVSAMPVPGEIISAGPVSFINGFNNVFTALGGEIVLAPASGGTINIIWSWPQGLGVNAQASGDSLMNLAVTSSLIHTAGFSPQLEVYITDET